MSSSRADSTTPLPELSDDAAPHLDIVAGRGERALVAGALGLAVLAALTALLDQASVHAFVGNSDGATVVLEGVALAHGHLLLGGWALSLDSFWTVDALLYGVATAIEGTAPSLMHLVPAFIAAAVVMTIGLVAGAGRRGAGRVVAAAVTVVVLALPGHALAFFLLQGPWHVATALYCLLAFVALRSGRFGWAWVLAVVLLAAGLLGDLQMLAFGVIPVALAGVAASARKRSWSAGLSTAAAAPVSLVVAFVVRKIASAIGSFTVSESHHTVGRTQFDANLGHAVNWSLSLFGVHQGPFGGPRISHLVELAHLAGLVVVGIGCAVAIVELVRAAVSGVGVRGVSEREWRVSDPALFALCGSFATFSLLTLSGNLAYGRYLDAPFVFAALLGASFAGRIADQVRSRRVALGALAVGAVVVACYCDELATTLSVRPPRPPTLVLERFLEAHHLTNGIGEYWAASVVTVDTKGAVTLRPVVANTSGIIVRDGRQSAAAWYSANRFQFIVYDETDPFGRVESATVKATFGSPSTTYKVGAYTVATWAHPITLPPGEFA